MLRVLSLGAGVQSTTLLLMSEIGELPLLDHAVFADTGCEGEATYAHLQWLEATVTRIPILRVSTGNLAADFLARIAAQGNWHGMPPLYLRDEHTSRISMLLRACTRDYKIKPIHDAYKRLLGLKPRQRLPVSPALEQWKGISVDEMQRAACAREKWLTNRYPLLEKRMRREHCLEWMEQHGYPAPPKSACVFCPYKSNNNWRQMQHDYPQDFAAAVAFDDALRTSGQRIRGTYGDAYVHRSAIPLKLVDFRSDEDKGQLNMFAEKECTGMCGV